VNDDNYVYVERIDEPEFGCEGVQGNLPICDEVTIRKGEETIVCKIEERLIWENKIDEHMWISKDMWHRLNANTES
jgi:hypothetical protein